MSWWIVFLAIWVTAVISVWPEMLAVLRRMRVILRALYAALIR